MEKEHYIFSKKFSPEEAEEEIESMAKKKEETFKPIEGELEKTPQEIRFIEKINSYLDKEFEELKLKEKASISPNQIHLFPEETFSKNFPESKFMAFNQLNGIYLNKSRCDKPQLLFKVMLHEALHTLSFCKYHFDSTEENKIVKEYRSGYRTINPKENYHEHFRGLNEAVIDKMVREIINKHREELAEELNIMFKEEEESYLYYSDYIKILDVIIQKIADRKHEDKEAIWRRFKKGLFTGEMMHLRDLEKSSGKQSLRMIAALNSGTKDLPAEEINRKVLKYFETDNDQEKNKIAEEILIEREKLRYQEGKK